MSFNGSGTFVVNTAGQPVVPNTVISATAFNALTNDLANGLSTCITKDGQTTPTANIPMGNNKITGLAPGTSGTDAANLSQVQGSTAKLLQSVTGTDTITAAMVPALTSYSAGQMFYFVAVGDNTGAVTINIDSLGAKSVTRDGSTALVAGDIVSGEIALIVYDGTRFQLLNGNSFTNLNVSGTLAVGSTSTFTGAATFSAGTANQVQYLNASKVLTGSANLTFDGTTLTANALTLTNNPTLSGGTANGVLYLNGSKVATSGSALVFDGTNLGLGVTPSAWGTASGTKVLQVGSSGSALYTQFGNTYLGVNYYWNGTNDIFTGAGRALKYMQEPFAGHSWHTSTTSPGSGGGIVTFTQAMTLDADRRLQLNTTTFVGNEQFIIGFSSSGSVTQALNTRDTNASANNNSHIVLRRSDDTYLGALGRAGTDAAMFVDGNSYLSLRTGATERARITSGGDLLVGKTTTGLGTVGSVQYSDGTYVASIAGSTSAITTLQIYSTGATANRFYVDLAGTVFATNTTISAISDQRFKENIRDLDVGLNAIMALKPRKFDWKAGKGKDIKDDRGFIAQEFEQVFPDLIDEWKDTAPEGEAPYKSVRQDLIPVLVKAIQEQQALITALTARVAALEAK